MNFSPGIYPGLDFETYLAIDAANASSLKLARKSIQHMLAPRRESDAFDVGRSVHSLILEGWEAFKERTAVWPKTFHTKDGRETSSRNTTEAKEWRERMESEGLTILNRHEVQLVKTIAKKVSENPAAASLLTDAKPRSTCREVTYVWHDKTFDVPCKMRVDAVAGWVMVDLKSCRSAAKADFERDIGRYGYHLQAAHYVEGFRAIEGSDPENFTFIAVETEHPFGCAVWDLDDEGLWAGHVARQEAMTVWADWYHRGCPADEPVYHTDIQPISVPHWA